MISNSVWALEIKFFKLPLELSQRLALRFLPCPLKISKSRSNVKNWLSRTIVVFEDHWGIDTLIIWPGWSRLGTFGVTKCSHFPLYTSSMRVSCSIICYPYMFINRLLYVLVNSKLFNLLLSLKPCDVPRRSSCFLEYVTVINGLTHKKTTMDGRWREESPEVKALVWRYRNHPYVKYFMTEWE